MLGFVLLTIGIVAFCWWVGSRLVRAGAEERLPRPEPVLAFPPAIMPRSARHPRVEIEIHAHRHWGLKHERFPNGAFAGWALHLGFGFGCLAIDYYRRGRRP